MLLNSIKNNRYRKTLDLRGGSIKNERRESKRSFDSFDIEKNTRVVCSRRSSTKNTSQESLFDDISPYFRIFDWFSLVPCILQNTLLRSNRSPWRSFPPFGHNVNTRNLRRLCFFLLLEKSPRIRLVDNTTF